MYTKPPSGEHVNVDMCIAPRPENINVHVARGRDHLLEMLEMERREFLKRTEPIVKALAELEAMRAPVRVLVDRALAERVFKEPL